MLDRPDTAPQGDGRVLAGLRTRDTGALDALYRAHVGLVHGLALRIVGDAAEAEEIVQDVFVYVWQHADRYDAGRGSLESWLVTLARSRSIDRLRARASRQRRADGMAREHAAEPVHTSDPLHDALADERRVRLRAALDRLAPDQRRALEIAYWEGLSHTEIAARLNTPLGTIKTRIRQGMRRLRETLDASESADGRSEPPPR